MMKRLLSILVVVLLAAAGGATWYLTNREATRETTVVEPIATALVEQRDVITVDETTATLGFTQSVTVSSPVDGTVTSIGSVGDTIIAGTVVATIDGSPVVAMIGDVPGFRDLSTSSSAGIDVRQLETNLVTLGYDQDGTLTVDETYDSDTAEAVDRWKAALGLDEDGEVAQGLVTYIPGELQVDSIAADTGSGVSSGGALLTARLTERQFAILAAGGGTITDIAAAGLAVTTGTVLYRADGFPVVAVEGDPSALAVLGRDLSIGVDSGNDVKLLEQMLRSGGFDVGGTLVVDDTFDATTAEAVLAWWQSIDPTLVAELADLVVPTNSLIVVPAGLRTTSAALDEGVVLASDALVMSLSVPARRVTTSAPVGDATFALGSVIEVEYSDGTATDGRVVEVGNIASNTSNQPGATPSVEITIEVTEIPAAMDTFVSVPVTLRVVDQTIDGALVVPTTALLALLEGGYALEVVTAPATATTPATTQLIAVTPGLYIDGDVVVTGDQVVAGLEVVVPS